MTPNIFTRIFFFSIMVIALLIVGCGGGGGGSDDSIILDNIVKIDDPQTIDSLDKDSVKTGKLLFAMSEDDITIKQAMVGDIIVSGVTSKTPSGLLKIVTGKTVENGYTIVSTEQASLTDVVQKCSVDMSGSLTESVDSVTSSKLSVNNNEIKTITALPGVQLHTNNFKNEFLTSYTAQGQDLLVSLPGMVETPRL